MGSPGRPRHVPTDETREFVYKMAMAGIPQDDIVKRLRLKSCTTLRKHYGKELVGAPLDLISDAIGSLKTLIESGNPAATMFALKCRAKWRETGADDVQEKQQKELDLLRQTVMEIQHKHEQPY